MAIVIPTQHLVGSGVKVGKKRRRGEGGGVCTRFMGINIKQNQGSRGVTDIIQRLLFAHIVLQN